LTVTGNRKLMLRARTVSSTGVADNTKATKKTETFGLTDQPPGTSVSGPSSTLVKTMTFTVTGSATDDLGVNSIGMTIRDGSNRYLQSDGSVSSTGYTFRFAPDVVGAKSTTWSKEITVPVEGTWKAQARATDTTGQPDLDTADREWIVSEDGAAPIVSISAPTAMVPPTAVQTVVVAPGGKLTFAGSANDDERLNSVEITLRNNTTREQLAADGAWGVDSAQDWFRISPINLSAANYNWSYTTPFNLSPGNYSFEVRATDELGLSTASANRGKLSINAQVPGDAPPNGLLNVTGTVTGGQSLHLDLAGTATDDKGVASVRVALEDRDTSRYLQPNGTMSAAFATRLVTLASPNATSTTWTLPIDLPREGDWEVTAFAFDTVGQQDTSTSGATARYRIYPGDVAPTLNEGLLAPSEGTTFTDGRIFVSGRAEDDKAMQRVEVGIVDSQGRYMSSSGGFTSTSPSWRTAFLTSPGTPGSNFSYTTPVVPPGAYTVRVRGIDNHDQATAVPSERHASVTHPPGNTAPVANFTISCVENVCTYDGRSSTDQNAATLAYQWNFGNGTGSGPLPKRTYTTANTYTVTLTVTDEWGIPSAPISKTVTITEPANNVAPTPVINPPACSGLVCNISGVGSADTNTGDTFGYLWSFGDSTPTSTSTSPSHTFPAAGTYTVSLTTTDGWGKAATITRQVTVSAPAP
jgi:PKD repeat protein